MARPLAIRAGWPYPEARDHSRIERTWVKRFNGSTFAQFHGRSGMIYVSKTQLKQVEYLIHQSMQGNHVLFDTETVSRIFRRDHDFAGLDHSEFTEEDAYAVEHHLERMMLEPSFEKKRAYLDNLDRRTYELVVRTYFNIVENNLFESHEVRH